MKEKYNFKIDSDGKTVSVEVSPLIFPKSIILHAAYHFIDDAKVIVEGNDKTITVIFIFGNEASEAEMEELAYEFNIQLISSFVENIEGERYAGLRENFMKAAFSPPPPISPSPRNRPPQPEEKK